MKSLIYISTLLLILVFTSGCQKYEVTGPDESQEDITLRREVLINDPVFMEEGNARKSNPMLKIDIEDEPDNIDGITDDDDDDDDAEESQDKSSLN